MRVNPNPVPDMLAALSETQQQQQTAELQIATGKRVNSPSDDPAAAAVLVQNQDQTAEADQFLQSAGSIQGQLQTVDSTLSTVTTLLNRAISLGVEGGNGTLNSDDRAAIATELSGIQTQLLSAANLSYQGNYVFAGTASQTAPYVLDPSSASGVSYVGNLGKNSVTLGTDYKLATNLPGPQMFAASGTDMFQAMHDLITAVQSGTGVDAAMSELSAAYASISSQRVFYGNALNQLNSQQTYLNTQKVQLAQQETNAGGADLAAASTNLAAAQTAQQATLAAVARAEPMSLFDYLPQY